MTKVQEDVKSTETVRDALDEVADMTPFNANQLQGQKFGRGNMLGGSNVIESATEAPWSSDKK